MQSFIDTTAVCRRNSIADVSFYNEDSFIWKLDVPGGDRTIINLAEKAKELKAENKEILIRHLRTGEEVPSPEMSNDLVILVLLSAAFLFTIVRISVKNFQPVTRFFLFRGINDPASADIGVLFHWQTTLLNLTSFFIISLFAFRAFSVQDAIPAGISDGLFWLICLLAVIAVSTTRHFICIMIGNLSGRREVFNEYLVGVYQSYHFTALMLFVLVVFTSFITILPAKTYIIMGICCFALMYLIRVIRLLLIFINRSISIFYLILYLCALEILPLAIIIRYFSDM